MVIKHILDLGNFGVKLGVVRQGFLHHSASIKDSFFVGHYDVENGNEGGFDFLFGKVGSFALVVLICVFIKATVNGSSVLAVGVPRFCTVVASAITANNARSKDRVSAISGSESFAPCHLCLNKLELARVDNCLVAVLNVVLRNFTLVHLHFLGEEVHSKGLLQKGCTLVFFVCKNALNGARCPHCLLPWRGNAVLGQNRGYRIWSFAFKEHCVNIADDFCLFRHNFW